MLEKDAVDALLIQPVVCVNEVSERNFIKIDVSFLDPNAPVDSFENEISMECGTSIDIDVDSSKDHLINVQNTGMDGTITLNLCPASGTSKANFYDR